MNFRKLNEERQTIEQTRRKILLFVNCCAILAVNINLLTAMCIQWIHSYVSPGCHMYQFEYTHISYLMH